MKKNAGIETPTNHIKAPLHKISYRGFGPIEIKSEGNWFFDNDYPGNVCHHIMSLRWLKDVRSLDSLKSITTSFINYNNNLEKTKSIYYLGKQADHTASIRLETLLELSEKLNNEKELSSTIKKEIFKTIDSCMKDTYKEKNNHGLMVDKAILKCCVYDDEILAKYKGKMNFVAHRMKNQFFGIFDQEGYCKEHSIAYQEFNLGVCLDILEILNKKEIPKELEDIKSTIASIIKSSQISLGWFLKDDGTYIATGDSTGVPKYEILKRAYGSKNPKKALFPHSYNQGVFHNQTLGALIYRDNKLHISLNSCWHSYVHKQNDDLNLFVRINGEDVIIDGGFSGIIKRSTVDTRSEKLHSTVIPEGRTWLPRNSSEKGSSIVFPPTLTTREINSPLISFRGEHTRVKNVNIERKVDIDIDNHKILILDTTKPNTSCLHRFIIPNNFSIKIIGRCVEMASKINRLTISSSHANPSPWSYKIINCIHNDKISEAYALDFLSDGASELSIEFS